MHHPLMMCMLLFPRYIGHTICMYNQMKQGVVTWSAWHIIIN